MADKQISDLTSASALTDGSLFVIEQGGAAKSANWGMIKNYISPGVAPQYSSSATYNVGDYVIYNGQLYRCKTPITTAEIWTAAHWTATDIGDDISDLIRACGDLVPYYKPEMETGYYITNTGAKAASGPYSCSDYIPFPGYAKVFTCSNSAACIGIYDENKTFIGRVNGTGDAGEWLTVENQKGCFIRISNFLLNNPTYVYYIPYIVAGYKGMVTEGNAVRNILGDMDDHYKPTMVIGHYITRAGTQADSAPFEVSDYIPFAGSASIYTCITDTTCIGVYDANQNCVQTIAGSDPYTSATPQWYNVNNKDGRYVRISNYAPAGETVLYVNNMVESVNSHIDNDSTYTPDFLSAYSKIICIGDSITKGVVYTSASDIRDAVKSYPDVLSVITGTPTETYAIGGFTAKNWWDAYSDKLSNRHGLYIVYLGTNGGLTDTIATDCSGTNPDSFASTNTGSYGKILQTITNNGDKAILVHCKHGGGDSLDTTNSVITQFGTRFGFPVIDISAGSANAIYHYWPNGNGANAVHYNDYGYVWLAHDICKQVNALTDNQKKAIFQNSI